MRKFILLAFMCACASSSEWTPETVKNEKWNWCRVDLDGPDRADKGWCFSYKVCRKKFLRSQECKTAYKFCGAGDIDCIKKNRLTEKWLTDEAFDF